ncbi:META domain-containing protein [Isoptericola haloaureus]|uniref:META domain-containing protein n=1 Tax=Isoptericola haloaureus TaxID=1542902 RepID=A0ABU7Z7G5_9MICO
MNTPDRTHPPTRRRRRARWRRRLAPAVVTTIAGALLVTGGAAVFATGDTPDADPLVGRSFTAVPAPGATGPAEPVTIRFEEGRVAASAGCNTLAAQARWDGGRLELEGALATTGKACSPAQEEAEQRLATFLRSAPALQVDGETIRLGDAHEMVLTRPRADRLGGVVWRVTHVQRDGRETAVPRTVQAEVWFTEETMRLRTGCNSGVGSVTVTPDVGADRGTLDVDRLLTTTGACTPQETPVQAAVIRTLQGASSFEVSGEELRLDGGADGLVLTRLG